MPKISVLLPVHNGAATLPRALESLRTQSFRDFEIIAVNDGSTDATHDVLHAAAQKDARVKPFSISHGGIVTALNFALKKARAPYLARMDADDACHPKRLEKQSAHLDASPKTGMVSCRVDFEGQRTHAGGYARYVDWTNTLLTHEQISLGRFRESPFAHPSVMFRKQVVDQHGAYKDGPFPEDYELWLRWLARGVRMEKLPETLLSWTDHPARLSRTCPRYDVRKFYSIKAAYLARWLKRHNPLHPEVYIVGSGRVTRKRADHLLESGIAIKAYIDIDPRKIGNIIHGRPVIHRNDVPSTHACFALSYVASHGADQDIQRFLESRGFVLGENFLLCA